MDNKVILCVEDNIQVQQFNKSLLETKGFTVKLAMTLSEAREAISREMPALMILDIHLPDGNGFDFLREMRKISAVPVIALTNNAEEEDVVTGLASGCDDYVTKPHTFPVLYARIEALLRRTRHMPNKLKFDQLSIDMIARTAHFDGKELPLTSKEYAILLSLAQNENEAVSAERLYETAWKMPIIGDAGAVQFQISNLRKKLEGCGYTIVTKRGKGYLFEKES